MTIKEGERGLDWLRSNRCGVGRRLCAVTGGDQRYRTLVGCASQLMNTFVELWRSGKHQREQKCADKPRGHDRPQRDHVAVAQTQLHCGDSATCGQTSQARSGAVLSPRYAKP